MISRDFSDGLHRAAFLHDREEMSHQTDPVLSGQPTNTPEGQPANAPEPVDTTLEEPAQAMSDREAEVYQSAQRRRQNREITSRAMGRRVIDQVTRARRAD